MKIYHVTESVVMMAAGDVAIHAELMIELRALTDANAQRPEVLTVKNLADAYANAFAAAKHRQGVRQYLAPLGLDANGLVSGSVADKLAESLTKEMLYHPMPSCAAIFMGVDSSAGYSSAHLYTVDGDRLTCCDGAGYACIGVGLYQAASSLMFADYRMDNSLDQTLFKVFAAKKRAEVAPGVGKETDIVYVSNSEPKYVMIRSDIVDELELIYGRAEKAHGKTNLTAERQCHEFLEKIRNQPIEQEPRQEIELSGTPPQEGAAEDTLDSGDAGQPPAVGGVQ